MVKLKEGLIVLVFLISVYSVDGNQVTLTYQGTPPFLINIRQDTDIGQDGGYLWAKTYSNSFTYDMGFAINPSKKFYYGVKDNSWSTTNSFQLGQEDQFKSKFFQGDNTARQIALGNIKYNINDLNLICGSQTAPTFGGFGVKMWNAINQLGFLTLTTCVSAGDKSALILLHKYQKQNNLPISDYIGKDTIILLDKQISEVEKRDDAVANNFVCYEYIHDAPPDSAAKNHLAFLYMTAMNAYPENLRIKKSECFNGQTFLVSKKDYRSLCDPGFWPRYTDFCEIRDLSERLILPKDDYILVDSIIHEHAHFVDNNAPIHMQNGVDTTTFYNISYDINDKVVSGWVNYKPRINMGDINQKRQHFFSYGEGWQSSTNAEYYTAYEDFAVSMEMYVNHGIEFRDYIKNKPALAKKYVWIKQNVFNGGEFNTGDPNYKTYAPDLYLIGHGIAAAGGITELRPDYIWDYELEKN